jgi:hypothetical protein
MAKRRKSTDLTRTPRTEYDGLVSGISDLLEHARRSAVRSLNGILTATYWEVGRRIVEFEQGGKAQTCWNDWETTCLGNAGAGSPDKVCSGCMRFTSAGRLSRYRREKCRRG